MSALINVTYYLDHEPQHTYLLFCWISASYDKILHLESIRSSLPAVSWQKQILLYNKTRSTLHTYTLYAILGKITMRVKYTTKIIEWSHLWNFMPLLQNQTCFYKHTQKYFLNIKIHCQLQILENSVSLMKHLPISYSLATLKRNL